ncbi:molybdate ABC transporter substrate-binding protein [Thioclava sp. SK-1]|uniref:molybdate ABC transporter substrate-binding protein n=1 Tax=Thioclava sp. SK-1 TaxID=1889770 RepID=UPI00082439D8|nr:molybdate ABC transporter substrate-binding protein [Thioclava sp. SK-1]OCX66772.1 molybdate ABC transporter substrate-binding protein [Thioclava sp. SK-1]
MRLPFLACLALSLVGICTVTTAQAQPLIFAAASLKTALDQAAQQWATTHPPVTISYAGSSQLARQITAGAPADLFISASPQWMDAVDQSGMVTPGSRVNLLGNRLVLIGNGNSTNAATSSIASSLQPVMDGTAFLAMALVDSVPAGQYGKEALTHLGLWDQVASQVAQADNVRAALALVALNEAPLGITYATDAKAEPRVHEIATFPADSHRPIIYPMAALDGGNDPRAAADFAAYLQTPPAQAIFTQQGFTLHPDP